MDPSIFSGPGTVFSGTPNAPAPTFNVAQAFGVRGDMANIVNMAIQGIVPSLFGGNAQFGQFMPQMSVYEQFRRQQAFGMQQQVMRDAAVLDTGTYQKIFQGYANLTGTPFGQREQAGAAIMSRDLAQCLPFLAQAAPDLVDRMHGSRGSAMIMAQRMAEGAKVMADPMTGNIGMSRESVSALSKNVFNQLYGEQADVSQMRGITAGQTGAMFEEMSRRGLMGSGPRTLSEIAKTQNKTVDQLMAMPDFDSKVQQFQSQKIVDKMKSMAGAVAAMKDIFGENGRTDAPMNELFNALQKITQNNLSAMNPAEVEKLVRNASNAARMSGMGLEGMMASIGTAGQVTDRFNLDRAFAPGIATNAALFAGSYSSTFGNVRGFGVMDKERAMVMAQNLQGAATNSPVANRMAALIRLADTGSIANNPQNAELLNYVKALKSGEPVEPMDMSRVSGLLERAGISQARFGEFTRQRAANQGIIFANNLGERAQEYQPVEARNVINRAFTAGMRTLGINDNNALGNISQIISGRLLNMTEEEAQQYANGNMGFLVDDIKRATGGKLSEAQIRTGLESGRGSFEAIAAKGKFGSGVNMLATVNTRTMAQKRQSRQLMQAETSLQTATASLGRGGPMQRLADAIIGSTEDRGFMEFMRDVFGGVSDDQLAAAEKAGLGRTLAEARELNKRSVGVDAAKLSQLMQDPVKNADAINAILAGNKMVGGEKGIADLKGKSEQDIMTALRVNKANVQRGLLVGANQQVQASKIDTATSGIPTATINAVRNAAQASSAGAGSMAMSLAEAIAGDVGAMSTMTARKAAGLTGLIRGSGELADAVIGDIKAEDAAKIAGNPEVTQAKQRLATSLTDKERVDTMLSTMAKGKGMTVEDMRSQIGATQADLNRPELNQLVNRHNLLLQQIKALPEGSKERIALEKELRDVENAIRADAQNNGYSASSILDSGFKSKLTAEESQKARGMFLDNQKASEGVMSASQQAKALADKYKISLPSLLNDKTLSENTRKALLANVQQAAAEFGAISGKGNVVISDAEREGLKKDIARQQEILSDPGKHLGDLMKQLQGERFSVTDETQKDLKAASAETQAVFGRNIAGLEKLKAKNFSLDNIKSLMDPANAAQLEAQDPAIRRIISGLDKRVVDQASTGTFDIKGFDKKLQEERELKESKLVRIAEMKLSGNVDITSGDVEFVAAPAQKN